MRLVESYRSFLPCIIRTPNLLAKIYKKNATIHCTEDFQSKSFPGMTRLINENKVLYKQYTKWSFRYYVLQEHLFGLSCFISYAFRLCTRLIIVFLNHRLSDSIKSKEQKVISLNLMQLFIQVTQRSPPSLRLFYHSSVLCFVIAFALQLKGGNTKALLIKLHLIRNFRHQIFHQSRKVDLLLSIFCL